MSIVNAHIDEPEWSFESSTTTPSGVRVSVTVSVPEHRAWPDVQETAEIIQMANNSVISHIRRSSSGDKL